MTLGFSPYINNQKSYFEEKIWAGLINDRQNFNFNISDYEYYLKLHLDKFGCDFGYNNLFIDPKIHTIRLGNRWSPGKVIHFVIHNRTKNRFQFAPEVICKGVQELEITWEKIENHNYNSSSSIVINNRLVNIKVSGKYLSRPIISNLAKNDGFNSIEDFFTYFDNDFKGQIIHWTNLKY